MHLADTAEETLIKAATEPAPPLASVVEGVPASVGALLDKALATDKSARWQSASEMLEALDSAYLSAFGEPVPVAVQLEPLVTAPADAPDAPAATRRPLRIVACVAAAASVLALLMSGSAVLGEPAHVAPTGGIVDEGRVTVAPPSPPAPQEAAPIVPIPTELVEPAATVVGAPVAHARVNPAPVMRARATPSALASTVLPIAAGTSTVAATARPVLAPVASARVCAYEIDEEGRKWPKRCP